MPHVNIMKLLGLASCFCEHKSQLNVSYSSYPKNKIKQLWVLINSSRKVYFRRISDLPTLKTI